MSLYVDIEKKLTNFNLKVKFEAKEEVFSLLGASGCGKSITLKCIAGIDKPDSGKIILNGKVLYDSEKKICLPPQKRRVGYMFQDYALFPNMTVEKNIYAGISRKISKDEANNIIKQMVNRFQLQGLEKQYPDRLSGGQKQRVAMARMLVSEPEIILLDEPFSALDSYLKWSMIQEMEDELKEIKKTVLFVSHDRDEVYRLSDRIAAINKGAIEIIETKEDFFDNPKTVTAAILSGCKNIVPAEKVDTYHVRVPKWDVILSTKREVPDNITSIGIHAHDFLPKDNLNSLKEEELNKLKVSPNNFKIEEDQVEYNIYFKCNEKMDENILWKITKYLWTKKEAPEELYVMPKKIFCLTDN